MKPRSNQRHDRTARSRRLVLIDDDNDFREALAAILGDLGFEVIEATDGISGLRVVTTKLPDLILVDQRMPRLTGLEVAVRIRANHILTPIVLISAESDAPDTTGLENVTWLRKPFDVAELQRTLASLCPPRSPV